MNTERNDTIRVILDAFDTIDQLRAENRLLKERVKFLESTETLDSTLELGTLDLAVIKAGREKMMKECCQYWREQVRVVVDDETGELKGVQAFESWRKEYVSKVPDDFSRNAFYEYFDADLRAIYDEEREKALADVHGADYE